MPDNDTFNTDDDTDDDESTPAIRQMRERIKQLEKESKDSSTLRKENALLKAGIDTNTPVGKMFAKAYDGELDVEAIKAAAAEVGLVKADATTETDATVETDSSTAERSSLASGAMPDDGKGADPKASAIKEAQDALQSGASFEVAAGSFVGRLAQAAMEGDARVTVPKGSVW